MVIIPSKDSLGASFLISNSLQIQGKWQTDRLPQVQEDTNAPGYL